MVLFFIVDDFLKYLGFRLKMMNENKIGRFGRCDSKKLKFYLIFLNGF